MKVLSKNTGRIISTDDIAGYSELGIVPAYMKFAPKDKNLHPGKTFYAIDERGMLGKTLDDLTSLDCHSGWQTLPFPLPDGDIIETKDGIFYRIFVARSDGGYDAVSDQHFVRVYARDEMTQASKNIEDYESRRGIRPIAHSCGEQWEAQPPEPDNWKDWFISPFAQSENVLHLNKRLRRSKSDLSDSKNEQDKPSLKFIMGCMLELIKEISEKSGRKYTQNNIREALQNRYPEELYRGMGISKKTIDNAFLEANKKRVECEIAAKGTAKVIAAFDRSREK